MKNIPNEVKKSIECRIDLTEKEKAMTLEDLEEYFQLRNARLKKEGKTSDTYFHLNISKK